MTTTTKKNLYEGMYLIGANISEEARAGSLDKIEKEIEGFGGKVLKKHDLGVRRLAYEIDGQREGHYHLWYFEADPATMSDLWREHRLNREHLNLLRFMTSRAKEVREEIKFKAVGER